MSTNKLVKRVVAGAVIGLGVVFLLIYIAIAALIVRANYNENETKESMAVEISKISIPNCQEQSRNYTSGSLDQASYYEVTYLCDTTNKQAYENITTILASLGYNKLFSPSIGSDGTVLPPQDYQFMTYKSNSYYANINFKSEPKKITIDGRQADDPNARVDEITFSLERAPNK